MHFYWKGKSDGKDVYMMYVFKKSGISFLLLGILVACSGKDQILVVPPNEGYSFEAKILKVENVLAVEPLEGELSSKDQINVSTSEATLLNEEREEIAFTDFQV